MKTKRPARVTLTLPEEFVILCANHHTSPEIVLRGFIADVSGIINWAANPRTDGYSSNGSDERDLAFAYFDRCGYGYLEAWGLKPQSPDSEGENPNSEGPSRPLRGGSVGETSSFSRAPLRTKTPALRGRGREKHRGEGGA
jgi:hypothetical protein